MQATLPRPISAVGSSPQTQALTPLEVSQPGALGMLVQLKRAGFNPKHVIDIGAYHGEWSQLANRVWPDASVIMFEANPEKTAKLQAVARSCRSSSGVSAIAFNVLLGARMKYAVPFYVHEGGSSIYHELTTFPKREIVLDMSQLDAVIPQTTTYCDAASPGIIKLDVQGAELDVLRGGMQTLAACEVALLELSTLPYDAGAPLFAEVVEFMHKAGFAAYDFCGGWRRQSDGVLFQIDCCFVKYDSGLRAHKKFWLNEPDVAAAVVAAEDQTA
jgi:FkbM family methyltransferase